jgi:hypothetical protein
MSELITTQPRANIRWQLLTTVSVLTLCGTIYTQNPAHADDTDRPTVWIELGGQLERVQDDQDAFLPPFLQSQPRPDVEKVSSASTQRPGRYAIGGEAKAIFSPAGTDWSFLAAIRYGRSNSTKRLHQQTAPHVTMGVTGLGAPYYAKLTAFADTDAKGAESHAIVDFMAGKDVGLGFGRGSTASFDFGVRFAQFTARSSATLREKPDPFMSRIPRPPNPFLPGRHKYTTNTHHHSFYANESIWRSFSGIGPSLSFTGSSPLAGNADEGGIAFDWGANAAVLFGRQKVRGNHKTKGSYFTNHNPASAFGYIPKSTYATAAPVGRSRSVVVPDVGGFAGLTFRHENAKVSFGYRADFFFGAMDGGLDTRHSSTVGFYGPYATISIGFP